MKFTKLTSSVLAGATFLSILAPTATFAKVANNSSVANGGTALPQSADTTAGISFGTKGTGYTGYLRLQYVPNTLDFGDHMLFDAAHPDFTANGLNVGTDTNNAKLGYEGNGSTDQTNKTDIFNNKAKGLESLNTTGSGEDIANKHAWVTVVDKQHMASKDTAATTAGNDGVNGDWTLSVASKDQLKTSGNKSIQGAVLSFAGTESLNTQDVYTLTDEDVDAGAKYVEPTTAGSKAVVKGLDNFSVNLDGAKTQQVIATAATDTGAGADVFAWKHENIKLTIPSESNATVENGTYEAHLTWTLSAVA
ncbi:cell surface protein [Latilactobacillus curvatus]|uniref:Cell surface protein n=1 Tax=Latilactobacillus curvatus TaxID=28038 RepID=A0AAC9UTF3_LATCU|nr:WxL domain-containing protein [Latilactobacillus curvatus]ASN60635.1 cell surface protein [Latilactobacillus curvatus]